MDRLQQGNGNCNDSGAGHWGRGNGAGATGATEQCCNGATATATIDQQQWINSTGALGQWGRSNGATGAGATVTVIAMGQRRSIVLCVVLQRKTSTIVVDETMQNVWTANIRDVLCWTKTCMMWSGILFRVSE
jgi:hypothetical protein